MKNAEIVQTWPQLKQLKYELKCLEAQIAGLDIQRVRLQHDIRVLDGVSEIIDGIAVQATRPGRNTYGHEDDRNIYGKLYKIGAVAREIDRSAEVYPNAHTSKDGVARDWGLKLLYGPRRPSGGLEEKWLNTGWAFQDAVEVAKRWVTRGELPSDEQQEMCRMRHKLDPDGRASRRRRLAYEAAWTAGHKDLAQKLLTERAKKT